MYTSIFGYGNEMWGATQTTNGLMGGWPRRRSDRHTQTGRRTRETEFPAVARVNCCRNRGKTRTAT